MGWFIGTGLISGLTAIMLHSALFRLLLSSRSLYHSAGLPTGSRPCGRS
jgi:hypothetical protein